MKIIKIAAILIICLLIFSGCGASSDQSATIIADDIKALSPATVSWSELDRSHIPTYFGIDKNSIDDFKGYINRSEVHFDIIAVFSFDDGEEQNKLIDSAKVLSEQMSENYSLVNAAESSKISNMLIFNKNSYVIVCVTDNSDEIRNYLQNTLKATEVK